MAFRRSQPLDAGQLRGRSVRYPSYVMLVLCVVYITNQWSRYLISYLYAVSTVGISDEEAQRIGLAVSTGIDDLQYGLLAGYGFSLFFVTFGLFMGRATDVFNRRNLVSFGIITWNTGTLIMGMSQNFWHLLCSRIVLGLGQSLISPACLSILSDYFPPEERAKASGVYSIGVYLGGGLSSLSIVMARYMGWRNTCAIVAVFGYLLAVVNQLTVAEPKRSGTQKPVKQPQSAARHAIADGDQQPLTTWEAMKVIFASHDIVRILFASAVRNCALYIIMYFVPVYFDRIFANHNNEFSYINAAIIAVFGSISSYSGGWIADSWEASGNPHARVDVPLLGSALAAPIFAIMFMTNNFYMALLFLALQTLVAECWCGPIMSIQQNQLPNRARGLGFGIFAFIVVFVAATATWVFGVLLKTFGDAAIGSLLGISVVSLYVLSALWFYRIRSDMARRGGASAWANPPASSGGGSKPQYTAVPTEDDTDEEISYNSQNAARADNERSALGYGAVGNAPSR